MNRKMIIKSEEINQLIYKNADNGFIHPLHNDDMNTYRLILEGNPEEAVKESKKWFQPDLQGHLSDDPIRNIRYLFVIQTGIAARYVVEAGIPVETAYSISDLYIQKADKLQTEEEIQELDSAMIYTYTCVVRDYLKNKIMSKPVIQCTTYIDSHFTEQIKLSDLAVYVNLNPHYLSTLFKKEMNMTIGEYINGKRISTAKSLLIRTDHTYSQIASELSFSSQSYFTKVFRDSTGYTPKKYRDMRFEKNISE